MPSSPQAGGDEPPWAVGGGLGQLPAAAEGSLDGYDEKTLLTPDPQVRRRKRSVGEDSLAALAAKLPVSREGTLFGIPLTTLRDQELERRMLRVAGIALGIAALVPWERVGLFGALVWPLLTAVVYLLAGFAPAQVIAKVPQPVVRWGPFLMSFLAIGLTGVVTGTMQSAGPTLFGWGFAVLVFGLLSRLHNPRDPWVRYAIGVGAVVATISGLSFGFSVGVIDAYRYSISLGLYFTLFPLVLLVCLASLGLAVDDRFGQLRSAGAFAPLFVVFLLAWLPVSTLLMAVGSGGALDAAQMLVRVVAYFGIFILSAPEAYDEALRMFASGKPSRAPTSPTSGNGVG